MSGPGPTPSDGLPLRWAVILLCAIGAGVLVGQLTLALPSPLPVAVLAGLTSASATAFGLHGMLGPGDRWRG